MKQSAELATEMSHGVAPLCPSTTAGIWQDPPPTSFALGPDHRITINEATTVIQDHDRERRLILSGGPGFVWLPIRYTPLDVTNPVAARRHFIQYVVWMPDSPFSPSAWAWQWSVVEILGIDYVHVMADGNVFTNGAAQPPSASDVEHAAGVRLNPNGEAEWVIRRGQNPRSGVIPVQEAR
jgi:hypothetical protein